MNPKDCSHERLFKFKKDGVLFQRDKPIGAWCPLCGALLSKNSEGVTIYIPGPEMLAGVVS